METEYRGLERTGLGKPGQDMRDLPLKSCLYVEMLSVRFPASGMAENEVILCKAQKDGLLHHRPLNPICCQRIF